MCYRGSQLLGDLDNGGRYRAKGRALKASDLPSLEREESGRSQRRLPRALVPSRACLLPHRSKLSDASSRHLLPTGE